jgi:Asp-tRNA(Asn)/Glu-tRNA(Gln) amidotransferase A subunit family amidase
VRAELQQAIDALMTAQSLDVIAYPPIASLPALIGEPQPGNHCALSGNSGFPALSLQVGFTVEGLPVGVELLAPYLGDTRLLSLGYAIEQLRPMRRAPASTPTL